MNNQHNNTYIIYNQLINSYINFNIINYIGDYFSGIEKTTLTGNYYPNYFTTKRIIVIQMK